MNRLPDFEGEFHLAADHGPVTSGYRPQHALHDNYQSSGLHTYADRGAVGPGEVALVQVLLITPDVYPHCLWEGRTVSVLEGSRVVGTLKVSCVINESLRVAPEHYEPLWVEPAELRGAR
jgi:translation elongation factor EF-Tu-like GTPase